MIICKECRCFHPVTTSDRYCGECCIGDTRNPIAINEDITGCCLFEPKQPKKPKPLTNGDRIRQMTDEELSAFLGGIADNCSYNTCDNCPMYGACVDVPISRDKWIKQEVSEDAGTD